jgi:hypothetical protein
MERLAILIDCSHKGVSRLYKMVLSVSWLTPIGKRGIELSTPIVELPLQHPVDLAVDALQPLDLSLLKTDEFAEDTYGLGDSRLAGGTTEQRQKSTDGSNMASPSFPPRPSRTLLDDTFVPSRVRAFAPIGLHTTQTSSGSASAPYGRAVYLTVQVSKRSERRFTPPARSYS